MVDFHGKLVGIYTVHPMDPSWETTHQPFTKLPPTEGGTHLGGFWHSTYPAAQNQLPGHLDLTAGKKKKTTAAVKGGKVKIEKNK